MNILDIVNQTIGKGPKKPRSPKLAVLPIKAPSYTQPKPTNIQGFDPDLSPAMQGGFDMNRPMGARQLQPQKRFVQTQPQVGVPMYPLKPQSSFIKPSDPMYSFDPALVHNGVYNMRPDGIPYGPKASLRANPMPTPKYRTLPKIKRI